VVDGNSPNKKKFSLDKLGKGIKTNEVIIVAASFHSKYTF
jgi:hypothetical protein